MTLSDHPVELTVDGLLWGYRQGWFPYPSAADLPLARSADATYLWCSPDPRAVMPVTGSLPSTLRRALRRWRVVVNFDFEGTVDACARLVRPISSGAHVSQPWMTDDLIIQYVELYRKGHAFSMEAVDDSGTVGGGLFGVKIGKFINVESMFHRADNASKAAFGTLLTLAHFHDVPFVDVQLASPHWLAWGAELMDADSFGPSVEALARDGMEIALL